MIRRLGVVLACMTMLLTGSPSRAAQRPQIVDVSGDANGINTQTEAPGASNGVVAPKQIDMLDIVSVKWSTHFFGKGKKRRPVSLDVTMKLTADPAADQNVIRRYAVSYTIGTCQPTFLLWDFTPPANQAVPTGGGRVVLLQPGPFLSDGCKGTWTTMTSSYVTGTSIVFRVPLSSVGKVGTVLKDLSAYTSLRPRDRTGKPVVDVGAGPVTTFILGK